MFRTIKELQVVKAEERELTLDVQGLSKPIRLGVLKYERGAVVSIPSVWKSDVGAPGFEALKAVLRPHYGRIEVRTEADPRFASAAAARGERRSEHPHAA